MSFVINRLKKLPPKERDSYCVKSCFDQFCQKIEEIPCLSSEPSFCQSLLMCNQYYFEKCIERRCIRMSYLHQ
ncbi:UNVERIFIED_CONTAM: hypothetical protein RMT77_001101 [Armadillidium vulgare]